MRKLLGLAVLSLLALPLAANAGVLIDTLSMISSQSYDSGNGDAWGGKGVFGAIYDLMVADDFQGGAGGTLTAVTGAYVTFFGGNPAEGLYVEVLADAGGKPLDGAPAGAAFASSATSFRDTIFGLMGVYVSANVNLAYGAGTNWIVIQPKDTTASGDWYYIARDLNSAIGGDAYMKDGGRANGGYGFTTWTSAGNAGFGAGDSAIKVEGDPIPEPATLSLLGLAALPFIRRKK